MKANPRRIKAAPVKAIGFKAIRNGEVLDVSFYESRLHEIYGFSVRCGSVKIKECLITVLPKRK